MAQADLHFPSSYQGRGPRTAYRVFAAVAKALPWIHDYPSIGVCLEYGALVIRAPSDLAPHLSRLGGRHLSIEGVPMSLAMPTIHEHAPCSRLVCPRVTAKGSKSGRCMNDDGLLAHLTRVMDDRRYTWSEVVVGDQKVSVQVVRRTVTAWPVSISGLDDESSLDLLEHGLGGRRKMGCGIFQPAPVA